MIALPLTAWGVKTGMHSKKIKQIIRQSRSRPRKAKRLEVDTFEDFIRAVAEPGIQIYPEQLRLVEFCFDPAGGTRMLLASRSYGKSMFIAGLRTAYELYRRPHAKITIATRTQATGVSIIGAVRKILESAGVPMRVSTATRVTLAAVPPTEHLPSLNLLTINGESMRGNHPDILIMDDPVVPEDRYSPAGRRRAQLFYDEAKSLTSHVIVIGQPVHITDLYSTLRYQLPPSQVMEAWHGTIPELDHDLEERRAAGVSNDAIQANYYGQLQTGLQLPFYDIDIVKLSPSENPIPTDRRVIAYLDPSIKGKDYTALAMVWRDNLGHVHATGLAWHKSYTAVMEDIIALCAHSHVDFYYESNGVGAVLDELLYARGLLSNSVNNTANKHQRIMTLEPLVTQRAITVYQDTSQEGIDFIENLRYYEYGALHDDAPDALAGAITILSPYGGL